MTNTTTMEQPTIQVGATVKVSNRHSTSLTTIKRETKTQWVTADDRKFRKRDQRLVGESSEWTFTRIWPITADDVAERARVSHARYLKAVKWEALDLDTLRSIVATVKAAPGAGR